MLNMIAPVSDLIYLPAAKWLTVFLTAVSVVFIPVRGELGLFQDNAAGGDPCRPTAVLEFAH